MCERFVVTIPDITYGGRLTLDLWDPTTYERLASTPLLEGTPRLVLLSDGPRFVSASPDGSRLVVPEPEGVRLWSVGPTPASGSPSLGSEQDGGEPPDFFDFL